MNAFRFIGKLKFNALDSKLPYLRSGKTKAGNDYKTLNLIVAPSKNNQAYTECFGMVKENVKFNVKEEDGTEKELVVDWKDRLDEKIISQVPRFRRFSVKLNGTYHEFITEYDFVSFVEEHIDELRSADKMFVVTGTLKLDIYNGKVSFRYQLQNIREVDETETFEPKLTVRFDTFYRKQDIDLDRWSKEKEITINAWTHQYIDKDTGRKYVPTTFFINLADETDEKKIAVYLKQFGITAENGVVKIKIKDSEVVSLPVRCDYINGSEEKPFNIECLTDNQRELVELGLKNLDDFKPSGSIYGTRITKFFAVDADLRDDYANGCKTEQITAGEFETEIFTPAATEVKKTEVSEKDKDDIDALFG